MTTFILIKDLRVFTQASEGLWNFLKYESNYSFLNPILANPLIYEERLMTRLVIRQNGQINHGQEGGTESYLPRIRQCLK